MEPSRVAEKCNGYGDLRGRTCPTRTGGAVVAYIDRTERDMSEQARLERRILGAIVIHRRTFGVESWMLRDRRNIAVLQLLERGAAWKLFALRGFVDDA